MKIDGYTKVVLTGIAILLGFIAFDYKPRMEAEAGMMGSDEMIAATSIASGVWHLRDGEIRLCQLNGSKFWDSSSNVEVYNVHCGPWNTEAE